MDDIPVPAFVLEELRDDLKTQGAYLRVDRIRFQPSGRFIMESPKLYSSSFDSNIITADIAVAKIKLPHLLIGRLTLDQISLSNGTLILPAMLSASGLPETAVTSIDLDAVRKSGAWNIHYANLAIDNSRVSLSGPLKERYLKPKRRAEKKQPTLTQAILQFAPRLKQAREQLSRFADLTCSLSLDIDASRRQEASLKLLVEKMRINGNLIAGATELHASFYETEGASLHVNAESLALPRDIHAQGISLTAHWSESPTADKPQPDRVDFQIHNLLRKELALPSIVASAFPAKNTARIHLDALVGDAPWSLDLHHELDTGLTDASLKASLSTALPAFLTPVAMEFAELDLTELITLEEAIDLRLSARFDPEFKPQQIDALTQSGFVDLLGARIDRSTSMTRIVGPQIDVKELRIRSGLQYADITIGYNLETLFRRIAVDGSVDPTMINGWFKPWWSGMWEGMVFPKEGMYTSMNSQATFKQPETIYITGIGHVKNMDLRSLPVTELRTRFFSTFHYVDFYDIELNSIDTQFAQGEVQFSMARDPRDNKDKLTGLWIDVVSTLDIKQGPTVIWEIEQEAREILEPYTYDAPPYIVARSSSLRRLDKNIFDIDLKIKTDKPFAFYNFPFQNLDTEVHIENDIVDIPLATANLGDGLLTTTVYIKGDDIDLAAKLEDAHFGRTLVASNTYFAMDGSETAQQNDPEELAAYGGILNAEFKGKGLVGDSLSYLGDGDFDIKGAEFGKYHIFGLLSKILEVTPLSITTLRFHDAVSDFAINKEIVTFSQGKVGGPAASSSINGNYNIETDELDFKARIFPFRNTKVPLITPIINIATHPIFSVVEITIRGTFNEPKLSLFDPAKSREAKPDLRDHRPGRN